MKKEYNIYGSEIYNELDLADFSMWLDKNINLILSKKQTKIFKRFKMSFQDLKLFGKSNDVTNYYKTNLKNSYEKDSLSWVIANSSYNIK
jgi:hypothetical protein|tara:strand:+ start:87 stop:356 length:270 start_codon:yes stop_codon:yes gene_type:complete